MNSPATTALNLTPSHEDGRRGFAVPSGSPFFGYEDEAQMREQNPMIAEKLIALAERTPVTVCSRGKSACVGSIDGKTYLYADGSQDDGQIVLMFRARFCGAVFAWTMENHPQSATRGGQRLDSTKRAKPACWLCCAG